ncbi:MAG: hypothetical protein COZ38_01835 [Rhodocyclales bacterium CG_4_10_14_3_um_filter_68_10]|nr:MAG: hypothetical protein COZ38_01835 [Rhodocyclales bacterium CG_4_10_14_3_um_filter_68_10]
MDSGDYARIVGGEYPRREADEGWEPSQLDGLREAAEPVRVWLKQARGTATRQAGLAAAWFRKVAGEE